MSTTSVESAPTLSRSSRQLRPLLLANFAMMAGTYAFVAVAGPMARLMHLQAWHVGFVIGVVGLVWIATSQRWGRAADVLGRIPVMRMAIVGFSLSFLCLAAYVGWALRGGAQHLPALGLNLAALLITRAAMGGWFAGLPVGATAWIADHTDVRSRGAVLARFGAAGAVGMVLAPPLVGWIGRHDLAIALLVFALLPLIGLPGLGRLHDASARQARRAPPARLRVGDARIRVPWLSALALYSVVMIANSALGFYVIDRLQVPAREAAAVAGYALGSAGLGLIVTQALVGRLPRVAPLQWLRWGALVGALGFASVLLVEPAQPVLIGVSYLVAAFGMGASFPAVAALASTAVEPAEQGACAGAMSMAQGGSMVIAPLVGNALYDLQPVVPYALIGVLLVMVFCATWLKRRAPAA
ncbi:MFS transporter [Burkholderia sp. FERM BP-3421]|uniref:MFS transporter n=1 Tax=Burkholderia sp. FERM BP-3421 TaxID=1494466 RepID=UPI00235E1D62|nr:MFS transporter [Burkholderia sp. FERM BP-3421]WDD94326.1 MFS transporter [Burkholderia sp. FERM BP-3421]